MAALTALRQCCCHPHIVKKEVSDAASATSHRLSMRQIMGRLVGEAYSTFDQAAAAWVASRLQLSAVRDFECGSGGTLPVCGVPLCTFPPRIPWAGACFSAVMRSIRCCSAALSVPHLTCLSESGSPTAQGRVVERPRVSASFRFAKACGGPFSHIDRGARRDLVCAICCAGPSAIEALLPEIRDMIGLVGGTDVRRQAVVRRGDGSVAPDALQQANELGGVPGGSGAAVPEPAQLDAAKDRK